MSRTRELLKFTWLIALASVLTIVFLSVADLPSSSVQAQQATATLQASAPPVTPSGPVVDLGNAFAEVAAVVEPAIVFIRAERRVNETRNQQDSPFDQFLDPRQPQRPQGGSGSGFVFSEDGYILTNNHVVDEMDRLTVTLPNGTEYDATVVGGDPFTDIAVIKIDATNLTPAVLGDSDPVRVGEWVLAFGSPLNLRFTVTAGIVSARGRPIPGLLPAQWSISDFIQTDAAINPGNSCGPLVNIHGQVVGINAAIASNTGYYAGYGFAIPINLVRHVSEQLINDGTVTRAALGVRIQQASPEDAELVGLDEVRGVVIQDFANDDSPAKAAGLVPGDLIVAIDGEEVDYVAQLQQIVGFKRPGSDVNVTVAREGGARRTFSVRLVKAATEAQEPALATVEPEPADDETFASRLGIGVEPLDDRMAAQLGDEHEGLAVTYVDPDGPSRTKLRESDTRARFLEIITHVNGERVRSREEFNERLAEVENGNIVTLRVTAVIPDNRGQITYNPRIVRVRTQ